MKIGAFFRKLGVEVARRKHEEERRLVDGLHFLYRCKRMGLEVEEELKEVREARNMRIKERGKGIIFRAKIQEMEEGEQCSAFFFKKSFGPKKMVQSVLEGEEEVNGDRMVEAIRAFYADLYGGGRGAPVEEVREYCQVVKGNLSEEDAVMLVEPVQEEEVEGVVKKMKKNKTPGGDGLPVEFYEVFWPVLKNQLCEVVRTCMEEKRLSSSMKKGIITLLYKKKGDQRDIKNWRPITLLNYDYKIIAKLMADRMRKIVGGIIGEWQTCAVPGRRISDNLILLRTV